MRYRLRSWQAGGPYLRARPLLKQPGRLDFAEPRTAGTESVRGWSQASGMGLWASRTGQTRLFVLVCTDTRLSAYGRIFGDLKTIFSNSLASS